MQRTLQRRFLVSHMSRKVHTSQYYLFQPGRLSLQPQVNWQVQQYAQQIHQQGNQVHMQGKLPLNKQDVFPPH